MFDLGKKRLLFGIQCVFVILRIAFEKNVTKNDGGVPNMAGCY